ncbi:MAG: hypothetical protein JW929_01285, partial [Anaerolineales bacterium]|nr:hypothetical protein [Anaerolineales bacterium]
MTFFPLQEKEVTRKDVSAKSIRNRSAFSARITKTRLAHKSSPTRAALIQENKSYRSRPVFPKNNSAKNPSAARKTNAASARLNRCHFVKRTVAAFMDAPLKRIGKFLSYHRYTETQISIQRLASRAARFPFPAAGRIGASRIRFEEFRQGGWGTIRPPKFGRTASWGGLAPLQPTLLFFSGGLAPLQPTLLFFLVGWHPSNPPYSFFLVGWRPSNPPYFF